MEALTHCNALSPGIPGARYDANAVGDSSGTHPSVCTQYICSQHSKITTRGVVWDPRYLDMYATHARDVQYLLVSCSQVSMVHVTPSNFAGVGSSRQVLEHIQLRNRKRGEMAENSMRCRLFLAPAL